jgi:hypothetical protein
VNKIAIGAGAVVVLAVAGWFGYSKFIAKQPQGTADAGDSSGSRCSGCDRSECAGGSGDGRGNKQKSRGGNRQENSGTACC